MSLWASSTTAVVYLLFEIYFWNPRFTFVRNLAPPSPVPAPWRSAKVTTSSECTPAARQCRLLRSDTWMTRTYPEPIYRQVQMDNFLPFVIHFITFLPTITYFQLCFTHFIFSKRRQTSLKWVIVCKITLMFVFN